MAKISVEQYSIDPAASQTQPRELNRVKQKISDIIYQFCKNHVGQVFHMPELEAYVNSFKSITPGSAGRLLRELRNQGLVEYDVINRAKSAYLIRKVNPIEVANEKTD